LFVKASDANTNIYDELGMMWKKTSEIPTQNSPEIIVENYEKT
jgi:hypothetical protein